MGYIVLDIAWNMGLVGKKVQCSINEIAAIKLDDEVHNIDSFRFIKESDDGYLKTELHFDSEGKIITGRDIDGWRQFVKWTGQEDIILIWDKDIDKLIKYMNKDIKKKISPRRFIHMEELYVAMTSSVRECVPKYITVMKEMELSIDQSMTRYPVYKVQSMVRLYRKLRNVGNKYLGDEFDQYVSISDYSVICVTNFFPKLNRIEAKNRNNKISELLKKMGVEARITGSIVKFEMSHTNFAFNYDNEQGMLMYKSKSFYKGFRSKNVSLKKDIEMVDILSKYVDEANEINERLSYGVGNKMISDILKKLCV